MSSQVSPPQSAIRIVDLTPAHVEAGNQAARILHAAFREHWRDAWPTLDAAREEVAAMCAPDRICRAALDRHSDVVGWIGGLEMGYDGRVWELHPLAIDPSRQGQGLGRALVHDLEAQVQARGGVIIYLGTDDIDGMTTLSGVDLWHDPWAAIHTIRNLKRHPYQFYEKLGYRIVGVLPDANGKGKPDIFMAKHL
ncbi:MAG: GNAT family N-acetyltransferase [Anaerolineae bacterium]|nr:GNAT family N-acetyltransferase [Anaerolineae bacterium]